MWHPEYRTAESKVIWLCIIWYICCLKVREDTVSASISKEKPNMELQFMIQSQTITLLKLETKGWLYSILMRLKSMRLITLNQGLFLWALVAATDLILLRLMISSLEKSKRRFSWIKIPSICLEWLQKIMVPRSSLLRRLWARELRLTCLLLLFRILLISMLMRSHLALSRVFRPQMTQILIRDRLRWASLLLICQAFSPNTKIKSVFFMKEESVLKLLITKSTIVLCSQMELRTVY